MGNGRCICELWYSDYSLLVLQYLNTASITNIEYTINMAIQIDLDDNNSNVGQRLTSFFLKALQNDISLSCLSFTIH